MQTIGDRIKQKRKEKGLTQLELAEKLGVTDRAVSKWEQNDGNPDISILPLIATAFDVSLDYLMTGNERPKEIVVMSRLELCAKNDDPNMIDSLPRNKDENGMGILDYIEKHNSKKVLTGLIDRCRYSEDYKKLFNAYGSVTDVPRVMMLCIPIDREIEVIKSIYNVDIREKDGDFVSALNGKDWQSVKLANDFKKVFALLIESYSSLSKKQKDYYFGLDKEDEEQKANCWFNAYPFFVEDAIIGGNFELCNLFISQIKKHNDHVDLLTKRDPYAYGMRFKNRGKIYLLQSTLDLLLNANNFALAYNVNSLLEKPKPTREIELLENESNSNLTVEEKIAARCVDKFMIVRSEIEKLRDLSFAKELLDANYVNYYEMIFKLLKNDKKKLFKFLVDNDLNELSELLLSGDEERLLKESFNYFNGDLSNELASKQTIIITKNFTKAERDEQYVYYQMLNGTYYNIEENDSDSVIAYFESFKNELLKKIEDNIEKEKIEKNKNNYKKEDFEDLLSKNNEMKFTIDLCSFIDSILKNDYKIDAKDLCERMKKFFEDKQKKQDIKFDDGSSMTWGEAKNLMNRLRIERNNFAHPEKGNFGHLTKEELVSCLNFAYAINGGNI